MLLRGAGVLSLVAAALVTAGCEPGRRRLDGPPIPRSGPATPFVHPTGIKFVLLPAGSTETPGYILEMRRPLLMSAHEITNAQYEKFAPDHARSKASPGDNNPVSNVTGKQAEAFCKWLTKNDPLGRKYKIPDPVEWEYAARGGRGDRIYPWGNKIDKSKACYEAEGTEPVGSYEPNGFGLYDVAGNVGEWVRLNGIPPYELRGGAWCDNAPGLRLTARHPPPKEGADLDHHGFRVLCEPPLLE